jgi:RsiW-degrading membrane proteinase PrsW (M82 family)
MHDAYTINSLTSLGYLLLLAFWADRYEREAPLQLVRVFFVSVLATGAFGLVKCLALSLCRPDVAHPVVESYVVAGAAEEGLKFAVLAWLMPRMRGVDEPMDVIVYLGVIALGFTFHENIGYFLSFTAEGQRLAAESGDLSLYRQQLGYIFMARAVPGHLLFDTIAGGLLAYRYGRGGLRRWLLPAFAVATLLHGTWNLLAGMGRWLPFLLYAVLLVAGTVAVVLGALRRSPYRRRQRELRTLLADAQGLHPRLPGRVIRVLRRATGQRQADLDRRLRRLLTGGSLRAEAEIEALIGEETRFRGRAVQFWELVMGILLAGFLAHLAIALAGQALIWVGCGPSSV